MPAGLISLLVTIALVGLAVWAITYFIPMHPKFKTAIYVLAGVGLLLYLLRFLGVWSGPLPSNLVDVAITIALVGLLAWALVYFIPMPEKFQTAIYVVAGVVLLFYLLAAFGYGYSWTHLGHTRHR